MLHSMRWGAVHFITASAALLLAFMSCEGLHLVTHLWVDDLVPHLHSVFLPFGALVLLGWVYGWLAVPLTLPATMLICYWIVGGEGMTLDIMTIGAIKVVSVPVAFSLFAASGQDVRGESGGANWRGLVAVGLVASAIGNVPRVFLSPMNFEGAVELSRAFVTMTAADTAGLLAVLLVAMLMFRLARHT